MQSALKKLPSFSFVDTSPLHYWKFDEAVGDVILDSIGEADGTLYNGLPSCRFESVLGNAVYIGGEYDYIIVADYKGITGSP